MKTIVEVYQTHLEELLFCLVQLQNLSMSPDVTESDFVPWQERLRAHLDGLMAVPEDEIVPLLEKKLDDPEAAFSAAYALLRRNERGAAVVLETFRSAKEDQLEGLCCALCHSPIDEFIVSGLKEEFETGPPPIAVAAAEVLAFHGKLAMNNSRVTQLVAAEDARIRRWAWRVQALAAS